MISRKYYKLFFLSCLLFVCTILVSAQTNNISVNFQSHSSQDIFTLTGNRAIDFSYRKEADHYVLTLRDISFNEPLEKIFKRSYQTIDRITYSRSGNTYVFRFYQKPNIRIVSLATPQSGRTSLRLRFEQRGTALQPVDYQTDNIEPGKIYVIIDPGHGGSDPGAVNQSLGLQEKEIVLQISHLVRRYLEQVPNLGVLMTRTDDRTVSLAQRAHFCSVHRERAKLFVSIHANAARTRERRAVARGLEIFYLNPSGTSIVEARHLQELENYQGEYINTSRGDYSDADSVRTVLQDLQRRSIHNVVEDSSRFANIINNEFKNMPYYQVFNRGVLRANFMLLRNIDMPSAIIETGFISHPEEGLLLSHPEFQDLIARGITNSILDYLSSYNSSFKRHRVSIPRLNYRALLSPIPQYTGEYTVQRGDSLSTIARKIGVTVADLRLYNNLSSDRIYAGQKLTIPRSGASASSSTTTPQEYTVRSGENLTIIANRFNLDVDTIKHFNQLRSDTIHVGQKLVLPIGSSAQIAAPSTPVRYTVKRGDTLSSLATRYGTTVRNIQQFNNLSSDRLHVGQQLTIPQGRLTVESRPTEYTVRRGDTLTTIAQRFNTNVAQIRRHNNLRSDTIHVGQKLLVPGSRQETRQYTVQRGDTLTAIANRYGTTVSAIREHNNLRSDILQVGSIISIP